MDKQIVNDKFDSLPEELQNDIYFIVGITPDMYAKKAFDACMRLVELAERKGE